MHHKHSCTKIRMIIVEYMEALRQMNMNNGVYEYPTYNNERTMNMNNGVYEYPTYNNERKINMNNGIQQIKIRQQLYRNI